MFMVNFQYLEEKINCLIQFLVVHYVHFNKRATISYIIKKYYLTFIQYIKKEDKNQYLDGESIIKL